MQKDPLWSAERSRVLTKIWSLGSWMTPRIPEKDQITMSTFFFVPVFSQKAATSYSGSRLGHRMSLNPLGICCQYQMSPVRNPTMNLWSWISVSFPIHPGSPWEPVKILLFCPYYVVSIRNCGHWVHFFFFKKWIIIFPHPNWPKVLLFQENHSKGCRSRGLIHQW